MAMRLASADILPLRFSSYANDLQVELDALRRDAIPRARTPFDSAQGRPADAASGAKPPIAPDFSERVNDALMQVEREFLNAQGLPARPWFRHMLIAPGLTTGYAPWPFPALQQAVEQRDAGMFASEAKRVVAAIRAGAERLRSAVR